MNAESVMPGREEHAPAEAAGPDAGRRLEKVILRLVKGGPERLAIEAGQADAIIDPANGTVILLPEVQRQARNRHIGSALDGLTAHIAVLDPAGVVLAANKTWRDAAATRQTRIGPGVAVGASYLAACAAADGSERVDGIAIAAGIRQVIAGERRHFRYDHACASPAGPRWFTLSIRGVADDPPARAVVYCEDVTERKRGESLLALEHAVARCLADAGNAPAALKAVIRAVCETQGWDCGRYFRLDPAAGVLRHEESWGVPTAAVEQFLEKSRDLVVRPGAGLKGRVYQTGQPLWIRGGAQDADLSQTALAPGTDMDGAFAFPVMSEDQTIGVLAFSHHTVRAPDDRMLQTVHSIGSQLGRFLQRQQALDTLRRNEARFRKLTELSNDWYWEQDRDFRFTQSVGHGILGAGEVLGRTLWELPNIVTDDDEWVTHRSHLDARWSFCDLEFAAVRPDGQLSYYCINGEPTYDEAGTFTGYCGTGLNITDRKLAEIALRERAACSLAASGPVSG
jgi:PAS domain S-box-containing protein